ncbi:MAG TPA: ERCC4 domain-containing protein [Polyangia bacterium]
MRPAERIRVTADNREQIVWWFSPDEFEVVRGTMPAGDYALTDNPQTLVIERKTLDDLVQTVIRERERFERELAKLATYHRAVVAIEGSLSDIARHGYTSAASPASIVGLTNALFYDHGVAFVWLDNREIAQRWAARLFRIAARRIAEKAAVAA